MDAGRDKGKGEHWAVPKGCAGRYTMLAKVREQAACLHEAQLKRIGGSDLRPECPKVKAS